MTNWITVKLFEAPDFGCVVAIKEEENNPGKGLVFTYPYYQGEVEWDNGSAAETSADDSDKLLVFAQEEALKRGYQGEVRIEEGLLSSYPLGRVWLGIEQLWFVGWVWVYKSSGLLFWYPFL